MNKTQVKNLFRKDSLVWEGGRGPSWKKWGDKMAPMEAASKGASTLWSDSCLPACTVTWTQDQPGPSPPLSLANATSKITDEKLYGEEAFGWDLVGLPLFSQVGNPTGPPVSLAPL